MTDNGIVHDAGSLVDLVQKCRRCGYVITDYRNTMSIGDGPLRGFAVGDVTVRGNMTADGATPGAIKCQPDA